MQRSNGFNKADLRVLNICINAAYKFSSQQIGVYIKKEAYIINSTHYLRELIFPRRCPICAEIVLPKGNKICSGCKSKLSFVGKNCCFKCGKPIELEKQEYCYDCERKEFHYFRGFSLLIYDRRMRDSIGAFKFHGKKEYADFYTEAMAEGLGAKILELSPDVLIPVPIHRDKKIKRGYNQAELLARGLSKYLAVPVDTKLLFRSKNTLPQKQLNDKERIKNLEQAFNVVSVKEREQKRYTHVMLVDDIYTTGSTIDACSKVLIAGGVSRVSFVSLCIGKGY